MLFDTLPVRFEFTLTFACPGDNFSLLDSIQVAAQDLWISNGDLCFPSAYPSMEVRRVMVGYVHVNLDAIKFADARHSLA